MEKDWASNPLDGWLLVSEVDDEERKGRSLVKGDSLDDMLFVLVLLLDDALCWGIWDLQNFEFTSLCYSSLY